MILNIIFVGLVITNEAHTAELAVQEPVQHKRRIVNSNERKNKELLARIVDILNGHIGIVQDEETAAKPYKPPPKLIQIENAYKSHVAEVPEVPQVRLHFIRNPKVLEEFVRNLKRQASARSIENGDSESIEGSQLDEWGDLRRNAKFRVEDNGSNDDIDAKNEVFDIEFSGDIPVSLEEQVTPFKPHMVPFEEVPLLEPSKTDTRNLEDKIKLKNRYQVKVSGVNEENKEENVDARPHHDWKEDLLKDKLKSEEKANDSWEDVKKKTNKDEWDLLKVKVTKQDFIGSDKNDWDVKNKQDDENIKKEKRHELKNNKENSSRKQKDLYDSMEVERTKKKKKNHREKYSPGKIKDLLENNEMKTKNKFKNNWNRKKENYDDDVNDRKKKKKDNLDDDDDSNRKKKKQQRDDLEESVGQERTTKKRKKAKWEEPKDVDNDWDKVGRDWGKKEDSWNNRQRTSRSSWKEKKRFPEDIVYEKPSYVARIPEYHNKMERGGSFYGRTPIPVVGRMGIYEDRK